MDTFHQLNDVDRGNTSRVVYGRRRVFDGVNWGQWETLEMKPGFTRYRIALNRGGSILFFKNMLATGDRKKVLDELMSADFYRQYWIGGYPERRIHALLNKVPGRGYSYHGVRMKAVPDGYKQVPALHFLALRCAAACGLVRPSAPWEPDYYTSYRRACMGEEEDPWNIGADVIVYRNDEDGCGWHADDNQEEFAIFTVVVACPWPPRRVCFRAKSVGNALKTKKRKAAAKAAAAGGMLSAGDEEIELFPSPGDAYWSNAGCQLGYEHAIPCAEKKAWLQPASTNVMEELDTSSGQRVVVVFRAGTPRDVPVDSGDPVDMRSVLSPCKKLQSRFGNLGGSYEELQCYSRLDLFKHRGHSLKNRGVSGNRFTGADAIVISSLHQGERDGLIVVYYAARRSQGAKALLQSLKLKKPVRVFRSHWLGPPYGPVPTTPKGSPHSRNKTTTMYRYDGCYLVEKMVDQLRNPIQGNTLGNCLSFRYVFCLKRCCPSVDSTGTNRLSNQDFTEKVLRLARDRNIAVPDSNMVLQGLGHFFRIPCHDHHDTLSSINKKAKINDGVVFVRRIGFQQPPLVDHKAIAEEILEEIKTTKPLFQTQLYSKKHSSSLPLPDCFVSPRQRESQKCKAGGKVFKSFDALLKVWNQHG